MSITHGVSRVDDHRVVSGILYVVRKGLQWRDAPAAYGPRKTLCNRRIGWSGMGVFNRLFAALAAEPGAPDRLLLRALPPARELITDHGYDSNRFHAELAAKGIEPCIPSTRGRKAEAPYDKVLYRQR